MLSVPLLVSPKSYTLSQISVDFHLFMCLHFNYVLEVQFLTHKILEDSLKRLKSYTDFQLYMVEETFAGTG